MTWKVSNAPTPRHVMQIIPVDVKSRFMVMHRSPSVRSAANCWSFPSGLHDIGETMDQCVRRELHEEYGFTDLLKQCFLGTYENIAGDTGAKEQYHWVISLVGILLPDVTVAQNKEPEKHDKMEFLPLHMFAQESWWEAYRFHPSFETFGKMQGSNMRLRLQTMIAAHTMSQKLAEL